MTEQRHRTGGVVLVALVSTLTCTAARAADKKLEKAVSKGETLYYEGNYEDSLFILEELVAKEKLPDNLKVRSLKYIAFCYFLLGAKDQAKAAWIRILEVDKSFKLDPVEESPEFVQFFNPLTDAGPPPPAASGDKTEGKGDGTANGKGDGKTEGKGDGKTEGAKGDAAAGDKGEGAAEGEGDGKLASKDEENFTYIEPEPVRGCGIALCLLPWGVGQYANGQIVKGVIFTVLESAFLGLNIGFWAMNEADRLPNGSYGDAKSANDRYIAQMTFFGLTVGTALIGIIDAFVFY